MLFVFSILSGFLLYLALTKLRLCLNNFASASPFFSILFIGLLAALLDLLLSHSPFLFFAMHTVSCCMCFPFETPATVHDALTGSEADRQHMLRRELEQQITEYLEHFCLPILSMLIGGAPFAMLTKLLITKIPRESVFSEFLFFLPARIGAFFLLLILSLKKHDLKNARIVYQQDHGKHPFRALGHILAVYSGALHLCFPTRDGRLIGNRNRPVCSSDAIILKDSILYSTWFIILFGCFIRILLFS